MCDLQSIAVFTMGNAGIKHSLGAGAAPSRNDPEAGGGSGATGAEGDG